MPPKKAVVPASTGAGADPGIMVLINREIIYTAKEFKPDLDAMAQLYKIAQTKNVPRKINSVVGPYGYKFAGGKVEEDAAAKGNDRGEDGDLPKTPANATIRPSQNPESKLTRTSKTPKSPKTLKTPASKKRKVNEEPEEEPEVESEVKEEEAEEEESGDNEDDA